MGKTPKLDLNLGNNNNSTPHRPHHLFKKNHRKQNRNAYHPNLPSISSNEHVMPFTWIECEFKCRPQTGTFPDKRLIEREKRFQKQQEKRNGRIFSTSNHVMENNFHVMESNEIRSPRKKNRRKQKQHYNKEISNEKQPKKVRGKKKKAKKEKNEEKHQKKRKPQK